MMILHCAECNNPLNITTNRGSHCLVCDLTPSMQDTYYENIPSGINEKEEKLAQELEKMAESVEIKPKRCKHGHMNCPMCEWRMGVYNPIN